MCVCECVFHDSIQVDEEAQQRLLTAVTVLKMCSNSTTASNGCGVSHDTDHALARGDSGCFAWTDTESEVDMASVAIVHRETTNSGLFVNKDFEDVPSSEEGGVEVGEEEHSSTDFMSKFANTLALFENEPKVRKLILLNISPRADQSK